MKYTDAPVCVVDDDPSVRDAVGNLIRCAGLSAQTFTSAQEFLAGPRVNASCLVLDVQMPGLSGLDLQEELARADIQVPIIFLSGHGNIPMTVRALKAGAFEFLTKPFNDEDLLSAIRNAIQYFNTARLEAEKSARNGVNGAGLPDRAIPVLAHELLQPLHAIRLCLKEAGETNDDEPADRNPCDLAKREAKHMARIIHDLMDVCRDSRGGLRLNPQMVDIATIVEEAVTTVRPSIKARQHLLTVVLPEEPVVVTADSTRLHQVLTNLLNNSAKFTEPGGLIRLGVKASSDGVLIQVRDNGKGMTPDLLPLIFDPFQQGNDPRHTRMRPRSWPRPGEVHRPVARRQHHSLQRGPGHGLAIHNPSARRRPAIAAD